MCNCLLLPCLFRKTLTFSLLAIEPLNSGTGFLLEVRLVSNNKFYDIRFPYLMGTF